MPLLTRGAGERVVRRPIAPVDVDGPGAVGIGVAEATEGERLRARLDGNLCSACRHDGRGGHIKGKLPSLDVAGLVAHAIHDRHVAIC